MGRGDGPISSAAGGPFFGVRSLVNDTIARRTDGYLYAVIVSGQVMGRGLMPVYGDKVRRADRWDLVNYVRTLQAGAKTTISRRKLRRASLAPNRQPRRVELPARGIHPSRQQSLRAFVRSTFSRA